ncbi:MAG: Hpt domain-containing protein, partial [Planctomycetota bacterium]
MSSSDTPAPGEIDAIRSMLLDGQSVAPELQEIFGEEAEDHLRSIYDGLDRLQVNGSDTAALADIRRAAHTLKGAAGAVGVQSVTRLAHRMEDLLDHLADNGKPSTSEMTLLFLSTTDRIQELTAEEFDIEAMTGSIAELFAQYETLLPGAGQVPQAGASSEAASDVSFDLDEDENDPEMQAALAAFGADFEDEEDDPEMQAALAAFGVEDDSEEENEEEAALLAQLDGGSQPAEAPAITAPVETTTETKTVAAEQSTRESLPPKKEVAATSTPTSSTKNESHIRVPLSRLDEMVRLVGEMIINRSAFAQRLGDFGSQIDDLQVAMSRLRGVSDDIETRYSVEALKQGDLTRPGFQGDQSVTGGRWASVLGSHNGDASGSAHQEFDELEFDRYNEFHLLARTLSEATGDVGSIARECRVLSGDFDALLSRWQRLTRDAQDRLMQIRMVPLRTAIPRLGRAVRSTASQCGKSVEFVVRGDHTEMDKTVLEEIADPLLHLVRNAVDHGIESPDDRRAAGKSEQATLTIEAINQGTQ